MTKEERVTVGDVLTSLILISALACIDAYFANSDYIIYIASAIVLFFIASIVSLIPFIGFILWLILLNYWIPSFIPVIPFLATILIHLIALIINLFITIATLAILMNS